ncbi:O-antigen ligase family protein [uncultured Kushneria sp.]|uniref:O-antigen ligase family protein n=1 Tax=uncultured Kushneria sp. TaxID=905033 RepID=UPI00260360A3|nr:O-antigen ligase family protein [uncultured Kushneria sp.]
MTTFWQKPAPWHCPAWLWWSGVIGLVFYATFQVLWQDVGKIGESLTAFLGLVVVLRYGHGLRNSTAFWLLLAALVVQVISWGLGYLHHPQWVPGDPKPDRLAKLFIFIGVAWWLGGSTRNTLVIWSLALVAFIIATFVHGGIDDWIQGLQGTRVGFGIRNNQHASMLYGVALLGIVIFGRRFVHPGRLIIWRLVLWLALLLLCLTALMIGQTRAVWGGVTLALLIAAIGWGGWKVSHSGGKAIIKPLMIGLMALVIVGAIASAVFGKTLLQRATAEHQVIEQVLEGNLDSVPYSSVGIRIHSWVAASQWISERPLVGWGPDARGLVIDHTPWLPAMVKDNFGHLHNFFIEIWVAYGLLGVALIAALAFWVGRCAWLAWRGGILPGDMALFAGSFFIYWMLVNQVESYLSFWTGVYVHNLVIGGLVTHYWRWKLSSFRSQAYK